MAEMRFVQLDEKNEERMNAIRKFTLMDDTFMTQVFSGDKESTQELLRIILKRKDLTVARSATQLTIGNLFGRSVRLDIYATDDAGKQYDIFQECLFVCQLDSIPKASAVLDGVSCSQPDGNCRHNDHEEECNL